MTTTSNNYPLSNSWDEALAEFAAARLVAQHLLPSDGSNPVPSAPIGTQVAPTRTRTARKVAVEGAYHAAIIELVNVALWEVHMRAGGAERIMASHCTYGELAVLGCAGLIRADLHDQSDFALPESTAQWAGEFGHDSLPWTQRAERLLELFEPVRPSAREYTWTQRVALPIDTPSLSNAL